MIEEVLIDRSIRHTVLAERIMNQFPADLVRLVDDAGEAKSLGESKKGRRHAFKRILFITREKGRFLRRCPGTPGMRCCNLFVLNHLVGCPYDCAYCFLQAYQNEPFITLYANLEDLEQEVRDLLDLNAGRLLRICTGELADSLALEPLEGPASLLVVLFARLEGALLELKTKSDRIEPLLKLDHRERTVLSWSLNTEAMALKVERGAPPPGARLEAAQAAVKVGYPVAFHFDPLFRYGGWKEDYTNLVQVLFEKIPPQTIRWISLGGFRYTPAMKSLIKERFPASELFLEEFIPCPDGKYRYFSRHRIEIYRTLLEEIRSHGAKVPVYLCMEADYLWRNLFGRLPEEIDLLKDIYGPREGPAPEGRP